MSLKPCKECGAEISTKAAACPKCGAKLAQEMSEDYAAALVILIIVGVFFYFKYDISNSDAPTTPQSASAAPSAETSPANGAASPTKKMKKLNYDAPIYTTRGSAVCPISIVSDNRLDHGVEAATNALTSMFSRTEKLEELGCETWKEGIQVYVDMQDQGLTWEEASLQPNGAKNIIIDGYDLTNNADGSPLGYDDGVTVTTSTSTQTFNPSFNCKRAVTSVEHLVCNSNDLSAMDREMSRDYKKLLSSTSDKAATKSLVKNWREQTRDKCTSEKCLLAAYSDIILTLTGYR